VTAADLTESKPAPDPFAELGRRRRPWWILWVLLVVALGAAAVVYARRHRRPAAPKYLTGRVTVGDVVETIEATGTVQPVLQVQVGSQVSGRILRVLVDFNSRVRAGQLLAEMDPQPFQLRVSELRAALASARAQLARAQAEVELQERNLARAMELRARGLNAPAEVDAARGARDAARAQLGVARAGVAQAEASLEAARTNLTFTRIVAPIDGVVITRSVDPGQTVAASFQAPTLFVIANDLTQMRVIADIDEADIGKLREGMIADARVDAFPGEHFRGVVRELRYGPTTTQGVVTYPAVIDVANPENKLRPGMTATITLTTARREGVLRVPNAALRFRPGAAGAHGAGIGGGGGAGAARGPGGEEVYGRGRVFVLRNGQPARVPVRTGVSDGVVTEVESPELRSGLEVITDETDEAAGTGRPGGAGGGGGRGVGGMRRVF
jgi:HlyD family secretion protein